MKLTLNSSHSPSFPETGLTTTVWKAPFCTSREEDILVTGEEELGAKKSLQTLLD